MRSRSMSWLIAAASLMTPITVYADATVNVRVRASSEQQVNGTVVLTSKDGKKSYQCKTQNGTCEIRDVRGGLHSVQFTTGDGERSKSRNVMIPPEGEVTLYVTPPAQK